MSKSSRHKHKFFAYWVTPTARAYKRWLKRVAGTKWDPR